MDISDLKRSDIDLAKQLLVDSKDVAARIMSNANTSIQVRIDSSSEQDDYWDRVRAQAKKELGLSVLKQISDVLEVDHRYTDRLPDTIWRDECDDR